MKWNSISKNHLWIAASSVISAAAGASAGYVLAKKFLEKEYQEQLDREIDATKAFYQEQYSTPLMTREDISEYDEKIREATDEVDPVPTDLVGDALKAVHSYRPTEEDREEEARKSPVNVTNIFMTNQAPGEEVLDALRATRDPSAPYIITKQEYYDNEPDHEQLAFTYWAGDSQLVDDRDELNPIDDVERVAGEDNLLRFGYGSADENTLYIRNESVEPPFDMVVTLSSGKYSVEVMGLDDDEPHLAHSKPRKFPLHDE